MLPPTHRPPPPCRKPWIGHTLGNNRLQPPCAGNFYNSTIFSHLRTMDEKRRFEENCYLNTDGEI